MFLAVGKFDLSFLREARKKWTFKCGTGVEQVKFGCGIGNFRAVGQKVG